MTSILSKISHYCSMIKIAHSVFALPFAFTAALVAAEGLPMPHQIIWIAVAMVGARSGAMGLNRIIDREIDAVNPRTSNREIPSGKISTASALIFTIFSFCIMVYAAYELNPLCLVLSPLAIFVLTLYSYTKRFTWAAHIVLGIAIAGAPLGAWIAIKGTISPEILPLVFAVIFWLAGFDILYAMQDIDFDKQHGLYSIPSRFGVEKSLLLARMFHLLTYSLLFATGIIFGLNYFYFIGLVIVLALLVYEHSLVSAADLSRLNMAFFNMNGYISVTIFVFTFIAVMTR